MADETFVEVAERNVKEFDIVPLFYDANEVPPEIINRENMYIGLIRAHDSSGIGQISNNLCKLWNSDEPDYESAKLLCYYNNQVIDGAKLPVINSYDKYPEIEKKINAAVGGKNSRMPKWFQFSKNSRHAAANGKKKSFKKANNSIMNRIADRFSKIGNMNMNYAGVPPFNWEMLVSEPVTKINQSFIDLFCEMDSGNLSNLIDASDMSDASERAATAGYDFVRDQIIAMIEARYGSVEAVYPSIVKYLFTEGNLDKQTHKQMFWRVFGDICVAKLEENLVACRICPKCGMHIPIWSKHTCLEAPRKMLVCQDCGATVLRAGPKQVRCDACQKLYRSNYVKSFVNNQREAARKMA